MICFRLGGWVYVCKYLDVQVLYKWSRAPNKATYINLIHGGQETPYK